MDLRQPRQPQQERGERRIAAILDAAEEEIAEHGIANAGIGRIARRAKTSIGAMYHFFADRQAVLDALITRYVRDLDALVIALRRDLLAEARRMGPHDLAARLVQEYASFVSSHPAYEPVVRERGPAISDALHELDAMGLALVEQLLAERYPDSGAEPRAVRAALVLAMMEGAFGLFAAAPPATRTILVTELSTMLGEYFAHLDQA